MAQTSPLPIRPRVRHIGNLPGASYHEIAEMVRRARGAYLRQLVDAARDVAEQCESNELRRTADAIVSASHASHPEYWDPSLRGVKA